MKKLYILIVGIAVIITANILTNSFVQYQKVDGTTKRINLDFSSEGCDYKVGPYNQSKLGIQNKIWIDEEVLIVEAYVSINCGESIGEGSYELQDNKLALRYQVVRVLNAPIAECNCVHKLTYKFSKLAKEEYEIKLNEELLEI